MDCKKIEKALYRKALGYDAKEETMEYIVDENGKKVLSKYKVTKKHVAPDLPSAKILLEHLDVGLKGKYESMTDEELILEKERLIEKLKAESEE